MANLWNEFKTLLPSDPIGYGQVLSQEAGDISRVQIPSGEVVRLQGQTVVVNAWCWFRQGRITGEAPSMTSYSETV